MKKTVTNLMRQQLLEKQLTDPDKYMEIIGTECPHHYGLPSFDRDGRCPGGDCGDCWREAMEFET